MIVAEENVEPTEKDISTRLQFRLPNNQRVVRKFGKADSVRSVFSYVKSLNVEGLENGFNVLNFLILSFRICAIQCCCN